MSLPPVPGLASHPSSVSLPSSCSTSSVRSALSGTYMLARTHAAPRSCFHDSDLRSEDTDAVYSTSPAQQESPTPTIAYFPPPPSPSGLSVNTYDSRYSADHAESIPPDHEPPARPLATADDDDDGGGGGVNPTESPLRPSDPRSFRHLFPSPDCLLIRHDNTTPDGNMNLRVDTLAGGRGRGPVTVQLFHLRMLDLAGRHFSLRRYCRDSGREVCFSKRAYTSPGDSGTARHKRQRRGIQRSVSSALRYVTGRLHRSRAPRPSCLSLPPPPPSPSPSAASAATSTRSASPANGPTPSPSPSPPPAPLAPTDTIRLEFNNYARVQLTRRDPKRYRFEWWGHTYTWRRTAPGPGPGPGPGTISLALRDDTRRVLARVHHHPLPPAEADSLRRAGDWVPPCCLWFRASVVTGPRDVAEIFLATGLVVLVDECIRRAGPEDASSPALRSPTCLRRVFARWAFGVGGPVCVF
ncbi:hypothetical protein E4U53_004564 [Claviceps sorghi]|nr:hypothetical protein E4U53_004564 [Claviceps sorghi]